MATRSSAKRTGNVVRASPAAFYVYVIELDDAVGPRVDPEKPSVYVGQSWLPPPERFKQHKSGYKASRAVNKFGVDLLPDLYEHLNPLPTRAAAESMEVGLADSLRARGFSVYGGH